MKRFLVLVVALLTMVAFASTALAQAPAKTAAPEKAAPAPAPKAAAEKAKPKAPKPIEGVVAAYEAGTMIKVKAKDKEWTFEATANTKATGEIKEGAKVKVAYKKEGEKMIATTITGPKTKPPKKEAAKPQEAPKK